MTDILIDKIIEKQNPVCVGLDTSFDYLPDEMREGISDMGAMAEAVYRFNCGIVDAVEDVVPAVKVQVAYYEALGPAGLETFRKTCLYAKKKGLFVIADAKRNDIGATASQYAKAFQEVFYADFLTVNGYLGTDGVLPFLTREDKGIFVLVKTSNPSSGELQNLKLADGRTVFECMGDMVEKWGEGSVGRYGYSRVGAVVGATWPEEAKILRARLPHTFFLVPGYGAQGGSAETLRNCFREGGMGAVVNNSRGILLNYRKENCDYPTGARRAALAMKKDLLSVLGEIHA